MNGTTTRAGQPIRAGVNIYRLSPDPCAIFAAGGQPTQGSEIVATPEGSYTMTLKPGTYILLVSPRSAPGGNWFWKPSTSSWVTGCSVAETITVTQNTIFNINLP